MAFDQATPLRSTEFADAAEKGNLMQTGRSRPRHFRFGLFCHRLTQLICMRTQLPPFNYFHRLDYRSVTALYVRNLTRLKGVRAVYQVGGMGERPVYGFSDLDLIVFIENEAKRCA